MLKPLPTSWPDVHNISLLRRQKRAKEEAARARRLGVSIGEYFNDTHVDRREHEQAPEPEPDARPSGGTTDISAASSFRRRLRRDPSLLNAAATDSQRRLKKLPALDAPHRSRKVRDGSCVVEDGEKKEARSDDSLSDTDRSDYDEERGGGLGTLTRAESRLSPVAECREHSRSAWLHFPHVELVFLFFAYEGAVASQVSALREAGCPPVMIAAGLALVRKQHALSFGFGGMFLIVLLWCVVPQRLWKNLLIGSGTCKCSGSRSVTRTIASSFEHIHACCCCLLRGVRRVLAAISRLVESTAVLPWDAGNVCQRRSVLQL